MFLGLGWLVFSISSAMIGTKRDNAIPSFLMGGFFGPLGIVYALVNNGNRIPCPACFETIHPAASICPHCQSTLLDPE
jgi:hypothetical protein